MVWLEPLLSFYSQRPGCSIGDHSSYSAPSRALDYSQVDHMFDGLSTWDLSLFFSSRRRTFLTPLRLSLGL